MRMVKQVAVRSQRASRALREFPISFSKAGNTSGGLSAGEMCNVNVCLFLTHWLLCDKRTAKKEE